LNAFDSPALQLNFWKKISQIVPRFRGFRESHANIAASEKRELALGALVDLNAFDCRVLELKFCWLLVWGFS